MGPSLPERPPFALRARLLTPLAAGGSLHVPDGLVVVDATGRLAYVGPAAARPGEAASAIDLRPWTLLPGMVDLHAHLPQLPNAGVGFALDLLTWLDRLTFPIEQSWSDPAIPERLAPSIFAAFAAAGTTTVLAYGVVYEAAMEASFRAAEAHGIRAILGKVMMDRGTYDPTIEPSTILDRTLRESSDLIARWHGADDGRLGYAVTPRFAISCTDDLLRESAALARSTGTWWQTHLSEDPFEIAEVRRLFPDALDYVDVYDRAGGLGDRTILAHGIHLSDRELARLVETGTRLAHCPASNLFIGAGVMPLARYLEAGLAVGLGSDVSGGPDPSIFSVMRAGAYAQMARRTLVADQGPILDPLGWLRMGTIEGARALGLEDAIGSLETGKEADLIAVDPALVAAVPDGAALDEDAADLMSRLIFRAHPDMVRAAWVRGRRLDGPARQNR
ncbi:MAG TPA: amidohydrolase family protein [Candidatus Limnocylindrales bacterium]|nr:amidohydrolase family protein [Candidatus Limnocylindrales bacterium]